MPNGIKVDIEYDGFHWHQDAEKDRRRDEVVKNNGYKVLRIKSGHKIPTIEQLQEAFEYLSKPDTTFTQIILSDWKIN